MCTGLLDKRDHHPRIRISSEGLEGLPLHSNCFHHPKIMQCNGSSVDFCLLQVKEIIVLSPPPAKRLVSQGTCAQHLTLCGYCVSVVCVCVRCPLDGCDALIRKRGTYCDEKTVRYMCTHSHGQNIEE